MSERDYLINKAFRLPKFGRGPKPDKFQYGLQGMLPADRAAFGMKAGSPARFIAASGTASKPMSLAGQERAARGKFLATRAKANASASASRRMSVAVPTRVPPGMHPGQGSLHGPGSAAYRRY